MKKLDAADPIWGELPADVYDWDYGGRRVQSRRCGGRFEVSSTMLPSVSGLTPPDKAKLTSWILERNRFTEDEWPHVDQEVLTSIRAARPMPFMAKCDRLLELLMLKDHRPGDQLPWLVGGVVTPVSDAARQEACAWIEAASDSELYALTQETGICSDVV